jgi:DDB1- and CUL4-associated factor 11
MDRKVRDIPAWRASQANCSSSDNEMEFGDIQVEIEEQPININETQAENDERSEHMPYITILQILLLINQFAVARTRRRVLRLLQNSEIGRIFHFTADDGEDEDLDWNPRWARRRHKPDPDRFPKVPSDAGIELMNSGLFGANPAQAITSRDKVSLGKKKLTWRILERELAVGNTATEKLNNRLLAQVR